MTRDGILKILRLMPVDGLERWESIIEFIKSEDIDSLDLRHITKELTADYNAKHYNDARKLMNSSTKDVDPMMSKCLAKLPDGSSCQTPSLRGAKCKEHRPKTLSMVKEIIEPVKCGFNQAWIGRCKDPIEDGETACKVHAKVKCSCGKQAIKTCSATIGSFVCGRPTCGTCSGCHH